MELLFYLFHSIWYYYTNSYIIQYLSVLQPMVDIVQGNNGGNATIELCKMTLSKRKVVSAMNVADRIQNLRKTSGMSQEELADKIGVSRQAVSKWESEQSLPDIEKIILLSELFDVTTDYILRGIEPKPNTPPRNNPDARIFAATGTGLNFIGLVIAILLWLDKRTLAAVTAGLVIMAMGCLIFSIGQLAADNKKSAAKVFVLVNIWFLSLIPISCTFNAIQGILGGFWWTLTPIPQMGNSYTAYWLCWFVYIVFCFLVDVILVVKKR